ELTPRLQLHSTPYSLRAAAADSSRFADSSRTAASLVIPATIAGSVSTAPLVDVNNQGAVGLRARGQTYATIGDGIDSTSKHFAAAESAGTNGTPAAGSI